ncbi:MAG: ROK family transcriptional regulator [Anaerolineales bacterium]|nr:ROK family transcriptional regulator [Anaerolineales bacterium]
MKKANQEESRQHNSRLVFNTIYQKNEISRVEIARLTGLTRTTVSEIVAELIERRLVVESGQAASTGGKPATLLQVAAQEHLLAGVDLANSQWRAALVDLRGQIVQRAGVNLAEGDRPAALELLFELLDSLLAQARRPVLGIGIGVPGVVAAQAGLVRRAVNLGWQDLPLAEQVTARYQLPVYLSNDSQAAARGEYMFGAQAGRQNLVLIQAGRGIGAGLILNGSLFYGDQGAAGEIGHIQIDPAGAVCRCGKRGCLETIVGTPALLRQAKDQLASNPDTPLAALYRQAGRLDTALLLQAYRQDDPLVKALVERAGRTLGRAAAPLVSALDIHHLVIAGSLSQFGSTLAEALRDSLKVALLPGQADAIQVSISGLGDEIVILGAASLVLKHELGLL